VWGWLPLALGLCAAYTRAAGTCGGASRGIPPPLVPGLRWPQLLLLLASWHLLPLGAHPRLVVVHQGSLPPDVLVRKLTIPVGWTWYVKFINIYSSLLVKTVWLLKGT